MSPRAPEGTLSWTTFGEKAKRLHGWRVGIMREFGTCLRAMKLAWTLEWLFTNDG